MIVIYSVAWIKGREVTHCDLVYDKGKIRLEYLARRGLGRSRRGLSKKLDLVLYKIEKERTKNYGTKEIVAELDVEDVLCWKVEENRERGIGREYENSVLFLLKTKQGTFRFIVSKKALHVLDELIKKLKRREIPACRKV